jgi:hypothetical protein
LLSTIYFCQNGWLEARGREIGRQNRICIRASAEAEGTRSCRNFGAAKALCAGQIGQMLRFFSFPEIAEWVILGLWAIRQGLARRPADKVIL